MKERWTIEVDVDVEQTGSTWPHMHQVPHVNLFNSEDGLVDLLEDGIHEHVYMRCEIVLPWRVVKRERIPEESRA